MTNKEAFDQWLREPLQEEPHGAVLQTIALQIQYKINARRAWDRDPRLMETLRPCPNGFPVLVNYEMLQCLGGAHGFSHDLGSERAAARWNETMHIAS